jgi:hypothetical protein
MPEASLKLNLSPKARMNTHLISQPCSNMGRTLVCLIRKSREILFLFKTACLNYRPGMRTQQELPAHRVAISLAASVVQEELACPLGLPSQVALR